MRNRIFSVVNNEINEFIKADVGGGGGRKRGRGLYVESYKH